MSISDDRIAQLQLPDPADADFYSESNVKHLQRSIQQLEAGRVIVKTMEELDMEDKV